jgi:ribosomal protein S18 acetylase RimI-like enzyme
VQNHVRACAPRGNNYDRTIQVGYEGSTLAGFVELEVQRGTAPDTGEVFGQLLIACLAVGVEYRGKGVGDAAVLRGLRCAAELDARHSTGMEEVDCPVPVWAHIRKYNVPSQRLFGRHGFVRVWDHEDDPDCEVWAMIP